ncbi:hypothetical protein CDAR_583451 [Caerostris darwini]|uniref:Uncharacterized protein n=1 Tax=Caerostris darwini TaxID=1538125 RepID=A0AAV4PTW4_9ARAC|nr:hypothetical protein CDAR_583451 [Caerostris darwini]
MSKTGAWTSLLIMYSYVDLRDIEFPMFKPRSIKDTNSLYTIMLKHGDFSFCHSLDVIHPNVVSMPQGEHHHSMHYFQMNFHFVYHDVRSHAPSLDGSFPDESPTMVYFDNSESFHVQHHDGHSRVKLQSTSIFY